MRERIADVMTRAATDGIVIHDLTISIKTAQARARITALLIDAS